MSVGIVKQKIKKTRTAFVRSFSKGKNENVAKNKNGTEKISVEYCKTGFPNMEYTKPVIIGNRNQINPVTLKLFLQFFE